MFDVKERREARLNNNVGAEISLRKYNLTIGLTMLWGIMLNFIIANFFADFVLTINTNLLCIFYLIFGVILGLAVHFAGLMNNPVLGFTLFSGFSILTGFVITTVISIYNNSSVAIAFLSTAIILVGMIAISYLAPDFFLSLGKVLLISLIGGIIIELIMCFTLSQIPTLWDMIIVGIFCLYIGYDWQKAQAYPHTMGNAIASALDIYLDVVNIFLRLLRIRGNSIKKN